MHHICLFTDSVLDPRYKIKWYVDKKWRNEWVSHCRKTIKEEFKGYRSESNEFSEPDNSQEQEQEVSIFDLVDFPINPPVAEDELKKYLSQPRVDPRVLSDRDVKGALGWWKVSLIRLTNFGYAKIQVSDLRLNNLE